MPDGSGSTRLAADRPATDDRSATDDPLAADDQLTVMPLHGQLLPSGPCNRYWAVLTATGGRPPYRWSVTSGTLPKGLHLARVTGVISGAPKVSGTYNFTVTVVDHRAAARPHAHHHATTEVSITIA
jgi:hypothetical protein